MKLNYDCVRDVLLALEENLTIEVDEDGCYSFNTLFSEEICELDSLSKYSKQDIIYAIIKLYEAGYINASTMSADELTDCIISDITYDGHEFLQSIKSDPVWDKVKRVADKVGSISIPIISSIASQVLSKLITSAIGIS